MKNLVIIAFMTCFGPAVTFAQDNFAQPQTQSIGVERELVFNDIPNYEIPAIVFEAFAKENSETVIYKTSLASTNAATIVYRISIKDTQGEPLHYYYNEDGTKFINNENL